MALACVRTLEYRVNMQYKKMSPEAIRKSITDLEASILLDTTTGKRHGLPSQATQDAKKIYQIPGHKWRNKPHVIKQLFDNSPPCSAYPKMEVLDTSGF